MTYDLLITNGTVVDGTGRAAFRADIGISDGRIAAIGRLADAGAKTIDATGLVVAPGVIDVHTHYDAQVCWDAVLASSAEHGTTTVIQGNCGIGVAPARPDQREAILQDLVVLEGMSYPVMSTGIDWSFETFPEYLGMLRRRGLGINVAPLVPLSTLRRFRMGDEASERVATAGEREQITADFRAAMEAGATGWSASLVKRQVGYKGKPLPCRMADREELKAYTNVLRDLGRGSIQVNVLENLSYLSDDEYAMLDFLLAESGGATVTYSGAFFRNDDPGAIEAMLQKAEPLRARGAIPQTTIMPVTIEVDLTKPFGFADLAAFKKVLNQPRDVQERLYRDPAWRAEAARDIATARSMFFNEWKKSTVLRVKSERMQPYLFRSIQDIAAERGVAPLDAMLDLALEDGLGLKYLGDLINSNPAHLRDHIKDPRVLIGLHDGGAHVDMLFQAGYPTHMLGHWVRGEGAIALEHAIARMTSEPADYFGFHDRGRLLAGKAADVMIFDPRTVDSPDRADQVRHDLPGGGMRLYTAAKGMAYVIVNGEILLAHGQHTGALPGQIIQGGKAVRAPAAAVPAQ